MNEFNPEILKQLYVPPPNSHKGQNGKLLLIGGSHLFHAASLWALKISSKIVDMVFYASIPENNEIVKEAKAEFRDGIVISRDHIENYVEEADCILIGPGLPRIEGQEIGDEDTKELTLRLLQAYPNKKWVIDGGSLQVITPKDLPKNAIITPHRNEFEKLFEMEGTLENVSKVAKEHNIIVVLKGEKDIICSLTSCVKIRGGNAGMTKGGTGDVLAGLIAALACKNDMFLAAQAGSFLNKKAGESLYKKVGYYFNASDLVDEIPKVMKEIML